MIKQKFEGLLLFAKKIWIVTGLISFLIWTFTKFATGEKFWILFGAIFSTKFITNGLVYLLFQNLKRSNYLFYRNLGLSISQLWLFTFIVDFFGFLIIVILFSFIK